MISDQNFFSQVAKTNIVLITFLFQGVVCSKVYFIFYCHCTDLYTLLHNYNFWLWLFKLLILSNSFFFPFFWMRSPLLFLLCITHSGHFLSLLESFCLGVSELVGVCLLVLVMFIALLTSLPPPTLQFSVWEKRFKTSKLCATFFVSLSLI